MRNTGNLFSMLSAATTALALIASSPGAIAASGEQSENGMNKFSGNPDGSWISYTGTVAEATPTSFVMDYGDGTVLVEVDDWDWYAHGYSGLPGDEVTVSGRIDKDDFKKKKIEAGIVYLHDVFTYHFANPADEEDYGYAAHSFARTPGEDALSVVGTINGRKGDEFVLTTAFGNVTVETEAMSYDPLDDVGEQKLRNGDRVSVTGIVAPGSFDGFFRDRELIASNIVMLEKDVNS